MIRIQAPSRLHFGLLHVPFPGEEPALAGVPARRFGGAGLMIQEPAVVVSVELASAWAASGPSSERALRAARDLVGSLPADQQHCFRVVVEQAPPEHAGLGVGTALALAAARAVSIASGPGGWSAVELARRIGRGQRSAVGVHGFECGGLVVEAGKSAGEAISPLVGAYTFPDPWRVVLIRPVIENSWHGARESQAFEQTVGQPTAALARLLWMGIVPALVARDFSSFGSAVHEYNVRAGEAFARLQGGAYAHPAIAGMIAAVRQCGIQGVGQSSWGPTVFAFVDSQEEGAAFMARLPQHTAIPIQYIGLSRAAPLRYIPHDAVSSH